MMQRVRNFFAFPLLAKDLTERAARPRTFVLRVVFGLLFIGIFWIFMSRTDERYANRFGTDQSLMALLGTGRHMFDQVVLLLLGAIAIFQPALMAGVITHEKERETLPLLFLADMKPWRLLVQKFIGGLLPMASLLLYGLPLAGIAYTYGGVTPGKMLAALLVVFGSWLQVGAFSLLCSAWFRTTTSATVAAYLFGVLGIFGADIAIYNFQDSARRKSNWQSEAQTDWCNYRISPLGANNFVYTRYGEGSFDVAWKPVQLGTITIPGRVIRLAGYAAPIFVTSGIFLLLARYWLVRRAFSPHRDTGRRVFLSLDRWFEKLNARFGGRSFGRGKDHSLPRSEPVLWRETSRGILGRAQHVVRLGLVLHFLVWILLIWMVVGSGADAPSRVTLCSEILLFLGVLAVAAVAVQSIGAERTRQTLDILLTTPVTAREIVLQKSAAARRVGWIFIVNLIFITIANMGFADLAMESWLTKRGADVALIGKHYAWFHLACVLIGLPLLFALVRWFSMWIAVRSRNRNRAFQTCLALLALWCAVPAIGRFLVPGSDTVRMWSAAVSPQGMLYINSMAAFQLLTDVTEREDAESLVRQQRQGASSAQIAAAPKPTPTSPFVGALLVMSIQCGFVALFRILSLNEAETRLRCAE